MKLRFAEAIVASGCEGLEAVFGQGKLGMLRYSGPGTGPESRPRPRHAGPGAEVQEQGGLSERERRDEVAELELEPSLERKVLKKSGQCPERRIDGTRLGASGSRRKSSIGVHSQPAR